MVGAGVDINKTQSRLKMYFIDRFRSEYPFFFGLFLLRHTIQIQTLTAHFNK